MTNTFTPRTPQGPARSVLFAPAHHARRVERALTSGADIVVLDLEDAVPVAEKAAARVALQTVLAAPTHPRLYVRLNAIDSAEFPADLAAVVGGHLEGLVVPKVESAAALAALDEALQVAEQTPRRATHARRPLRGDCGRLRACDSIDLRRRRLQPRYEPEFGLERGRARTALRARKDCAREPRRALGGADRYGHLAGT